MKVNALHALQASTVLKLLQDTQVSAVKDMCAQVVIVLQRRLVLSHSTTTYQADLVHAPLDITALKVPVIQFHVHPAHINHKQDSIPVLLAMRAVTVQVQAFLHQQEHVLKVFTAFQAQFTPNPMISKPVVFALSVITVLVVLNISVLVDIMHQ